MANSLIPIEQQSCQIANEVFFSLNDSNRELGTILINDDLNKMTDLLGRRTLSGPFQNWALVVASACGALKIVKLLLKTRIASDEANSRAFQNLADFGDLEAIDQIINQNPSILSQNWESAFEMAAARGYSGILNRLTDCVKPSPSSLNRAAAQAQNNGHDQIASALNYLRP